MTIQYVGSWQTNLVESKPERPNLNSFVLSRSIVTLCDKLTELGIAELRWHDSVPSYQAAVANSKKRVVGEYFRNDLNTLPPRKFFGITGHDETGKTICTTANRYDDTDGWDLREYIQSFWYTNYKADNGSQAQLAMSSVPFADGIAGPFAYIGDTSVDPAYSGSDVAAYLVRLCILGCQLEWHPANIYAWMARHHAAKGLPFRWGFPIVWPSGFIWDVPPAQKAYSDLCLMLCPPQGVAVVAKAPLDIGVSPGRASNTA